MTSKPSTDRLGLTVQVGLGMMDIDLVRLGRVEDVVLEGPSRCAADLGDEPTIFNTVVKIGNIPRILVWLVS